MQKLSMSRFFIIKSWSIFYSLIVQKNHLKLFWLPKLEAHILKPFRILSIKTILAVIKYFPSQCKYLPFFCLQLLLYLLIFRLLSFCSFSKLSHDDIRFFFLSFFVLRRLRNQKGEFREGLGNRVERKQKLIDRKLIVKYRPTLR